MATADGKKRRGVAATPGAELPYCMTRALVSLTGYIHLCSLAKIDKGIFLLSLKSVMGLNTAVMYMFKNKSYGEKDNKKTT